MIARIWRGWATPENALTYEAHFRETMLPHLLDVPGFREARLLRREDGAEIELVVVTIFDTMDAIRAFAGADPERAVVAAEARQALSRFEDRVVHYEVAGESR